MLLLQSHWLFGLPPPFGLCKRGNRISTRQLQPRPWSKRWYKDIHSLLCSERPYRWYWPMLFNSRRQLPFICFFLRGFGSACRQEHNESSCGCLVVMSVSRGRADSNRADSTIVSSPGLRRSMSLLTRSCLGCLVGVYVGGQAPSWTHQSP